MEASDSFGTIGHVIRCGRVSGLEVAAFHAPRACMEICRSGTVRLIDAVIQDRLAQVLNLFRASFLVSRCLDQDQQHLFQCPAHGIA